MASPGFERHAAPSEREMHVHARRSTHGRPGRSVRCTDSPSTTAGFARTGCVVGIALPVLADCCVAAARPGNTHHLERGMNAEASTIEAADRLFAQITPGWDDFPEAGALRALIEDALARAAGAERESLTITSPTSRRRSVRLAVLCGPASLDSFYAGEAAELSTSDTGECYLVYRRNDGGDYAVQWSTATALPESLVAACPDVLARAMFDGDR